MQDAANVGISESLVDRFVAAQLRSAYTS